MFTGRSVEGPPVLETMGLVELGLLVVLSTGRFVEGPPVLEGFVVPALVVGVRVDGWVLGIVGLTVLPREVTSDRVVRAGGEVEVIMGAGVDGREVGLDVEWSVCKTNTHAKS